MEQHTDEICNNIMCSDPKCLVKKHDKFKKELGEIKKLDWQLKQFDRHMSKMKARKEKLTAYLSSKGVFTWA